VAACALQRAVRTLTGEGVAAFLRDAHAAMAGAIPERCMMAAETIKAGTFAASANIRNIYGVNETALFFATPEKCKQHLKMHAKCSAASPVLHQNGASMGCSQTEESDIGGTNTSTSSGTGVQRAPRCLFQASTLRYAPCGLRSMIGSLRCQGAECCTKIAATPS
jgi:hypothetical protein